jgi:hypothetical protein
MLIHCFAGCSTDEVLDAVGLTLADLFPEKLEAHCHHPERRPFPASDVLRCITFDAFVVASSAVTLLDGKPFSEADRGRLMLSVSRLQEAATAAGVWS